ncbi:ribosomal protein S18 acetylase RimI-like enzyme [Lewinella aquimaris]|uniref:Ribosomal protein S18 acetylase RimI-like enzyme n=1 Tax=Neolewinella aquimaris TaxID=1835722 RepID=A0A840E6M4_9BACT|nr:GNAT family N-acetyltransferase [Neolewinella aquimaris]MBB4078857.1 ribosomal protein S18 acetylase RimI-like enzyme [Neolewinella aquimaris]
MQTYRIVPATAADFPTIERLARLIWPETFGSILSTAQIEYMLDLMYSEAALMEQVKKGHVFHLLLDALGDETSGYSHHAQLRYRPVGYVSHEVNNLPGTTKIHKIYLLPGTQGRGYGRALIDKVEAIARRANQTKLRLDVNFQNPAVSFYEHLGFRKIDRFDTEIGQGYLMEDWRMEKTLLPRD